MISPSRIAAGALTLLFVFACNADPAPVKVQASVLLENDSPWPGTLHLSRGFTGNLNAPANDLACVDIDSIPQDTTLGTATIQVPGTPRAQFFTWTFRSQPYLLVHMSGDSSGGVNVSRIGISSDPTACVR